MKSTAIIIGGGAIGLSLAWELSRRNFDVTVVDRDVVGQATSWAAVGILPPANFETATDPLDRLRGLSHQLYPQWTRELQTTTQIDSGFRSCGGWYIADTAGERAAMVGMTSYWRDLQIECSQVELNEVARREPSIASWLNHSATQQRQGNAMAWWTPGECQIRSPDFLAALRSACLGRGVQLVEHCQVTKTTEHAGRVAVHGRRKEADADLSLDADIAVVCAGPWSGQVDEDFHLQNSIVPIRGQVLMYKGDRPPLASVVNVGNCYLVSRDDGHTLVGSCEEEVGWQLGTTEVVLDRLRKFALDVCPELKNAVEVRSWSGLRPMTFDGFPMIGRAPDSQRVFVASGHYRSGLHLAPATAVVLSDLITNQTPALDLQPFSVGKQQTKPNA